MNAFRLFKNGLKKSAADEKGVVAIEFSFIIVIFFFLVFFIFEISRYLFISSAINFTFSTAARMATVQSGVNIDYRNVFRETLQKESAMWSGLIDFNDITVTVKYCNTVAHAVKESCSSGSSAGRKLAFYTIQYNYRPFIFGKGLPGADNMFTALSNSLSRRLIYVQEYERDEIFKTN